MSALRDALTTAVRHHQGGDLQSAERLYRQILQAEPDNADATHLLGVVAQQVGQHHQAVQLIRRAIALRAGNPLFHNSLGGALASMGKFAEARRCYEQALALHPEYVEACSNLANVFKNLGQLEEAIACHRRALELRPNHAISYFSLGKISRDLGRLDEAAESYRRALRIDPDYAEAHCNLGNLLKQQGKLDEAIDAYRRALRIKPDSTECCVNLGNAYKEQGNVADAIAMFERSIELDRGFAEAHNSLGVLLQEQGDLEQAIACCRQALRLKPDYAQAHNNLSVALQELGELDEAVASCRRALELEPDYFQAHSNLGVALKEQGKLDEAVASYEEALRLKPDFAEAHNNLALVLLSQGKFATGWQENEWRWQSGKLTRRDFRQPMWDGGPLDNRTLLVHAEQGLGDTIQFVRYLRLVKQPAVNVVFECQQPLRRLLRDVAGCDRLVTQGEPLPDFDVHIPLMSLPRIFNTALSNIPAEIPYLWADETLMQHWRTRLASYPGRKIGICWQGSPRFWRDRFRSIPLRYFASLAEVPDVQLVSLQKGHGVEQLQALDKSLPLIHFGSDLDADSGPFMDTAAIITQIDLVITSDTAVAHLAGALGAPVWLAAEWSADWRWLLDREDSPWYPTLRLFRQPTAGDWDSVFCRIRRALESG